MTITVGGSSITFPDSTTQTTAGGPYSGDKGQVFTASGTFTIPTGVTALKVTVVGGGGGGSGTSGCCAGNGSAGGTSSVASGTQTITTITCTGGAGGIYNSFYVNGGTGTNGDLNITGGRGFYVAGTSGAFQNNFGGGTPFAPMTVYAGVNNSITSQAGLGYGGGASGGAGSGGAGGGTAIKYLTGLTPGNTLTVTRGAGGGGYGNGGAGAGGVVIFEW